MQPTPMYSTARPADLPQALAKWHAWEKSDRAIRERLEAFKNDPDGTNDHELPGWKRFQEIAGNAPEIRELFVEMQLAEPELLKLYEKAPKEAEKFLEARQKQRQARQMPRMGMRPQRNQAPSTGSTAAQLLVASDKEITCSAGVVSFLYGALQSDVLSNGEHRSVFKKLFRTWLRHPFSQPNVSPNLVRQRIMVANSYGMKRESLAMARDFLNTPAEEETLLLNEQVNFLSWAGAMSRQLPSSVPDYLQVVEPLLNNTTVVQAANIENLFEIQLCDIALAALVQLKGQDWSTYRLRKVQGSQGMFNWQTAYFEDAEDRDWALAKWRASSKTTADPSVKTD